jgi:hypothetical protein
MLGLDPDEKDLTRYRKWFTVESPEHFVDRVMAIANVDSITMTNEVFNEEERKIWIQDPKVGDDPRFKAALRLDPLLRDWPGAARRLSGWGYVVAEDFSGRTVNEARRFLREWIARMDAIYAAVSLPPEFRYPEGGSADRVLKDILLPVLAEEGIPFAMMIGARRGANPALRDAGDIGGRADVDSVIALCREFPKNRFLVTMLARENQHELCVAARKFSNLMIFGCWWFLNNPTLVEEITRMRFELLGTSFIPQHSDARVLDQLIYKWEHTRRILARVLADKYADVASTGFNLTAELMQRDVRLLLRDNFRNFVDGG